MALTINERVARFREEQKARGRKRTDLWATPEEKKIVEETLVRLRAGESEAAAAPSAQQSESEPERSAILRPEHYDARRDWTVQRPDAPAERAPRDFVCDLVVVLDEEPGEKRVVFVPNLGSVPVAFGLLRSAARLVASTELILHPESDAFRFDTLEWDLPKDLLLIASFTRARGELWARDFSAMEAELLDAGDWFFRQPGVFTSAAVPEGRVFDPAFYMQRRPLIVRLDRDFTVHFSPDEPEDAEPSPWSEGGWSGSLLRPDADIPELGLLWTRVFYSTLVRSGVRLASRMPDLALAREGFGSPTHLLHRLSGAAADRVVLNPFAILKTDPID